MGCVADWRRKARSASFAVFLLSAAAKVCPSQKSDARDGRRGVGLVPVQEFGGRGIGENRVVAAIDEKGSVDGWIVEKDPFPQMLAQAREIEEREECKKREVENDEAWRKKDYKGT